MDLALMIGDGKEDITMSVHEKFNFCHALTYLIKGLD
jgi:hypothetical protein